MELAHIRSGATTELTSVHTARAVLVIVLLRFFN